LTLGMPHRAAARRRRWRRRRSCSYFSPLSNCTASCQMTSLSQPGPVRAMPWRRTPWSHTAVPVVLAAAAATAVLSAHRQQACRRSSKAEAVRVLGPPQHTQLPLRPCCGSPACASRAAGCRRGQQQPTHCMPRAPCRGWGRRPVLARHACASWPCPRWSTPPQAAGAQHAQVCEHRGGGLHRPCV